MYILKLFQNFTIDYQTQIVSDIFSIIKFVNEKELEEMVPKSEWISDLKGPAVYDFDGTKLNLPDDFPDQNFCHSLAY